ncbi:MAG: type I DNA topoisomerase [Sphaerochaetaceae bacterium]
MAEKEKTLIIVESPTKARTIARYLTGGYKVMACNGHVRDLPTKDLSIDIADGYKPKYVVTKGKDKIIKSLKEELKGASRLLLATDEDREGESISWHLLELLKPQVPYRRMVFHEITKKAILHALEHGRDLNMELVNAQEARRVLDRLFGYSLSPVLWRKLSQPKLSAGRVQSPGLRMVVERERERLSFISAQYWDLKATLNNFEAKLESVEGQRVATGKDFDGITGRLKSKKVLLLDKKGAVELADKLKTAQWKVVSVEENEKKQRPAPPFITSTLQQEGNRKLRLSAKQTMSVAQKLYENGFITYMRSDSPSLSQEGVRAAREAAGKLYGPEYLSATPRQYGAKDKRAQEAHEAIRPAGDTFVHPAESGLSGNERRLYELIWKRTLASQMAESVKAFTTVKIAADGTIFSASGNRILFPGFIRVYVEGKDDSESALEDTEKLLPALKEGQVLELKDLEAVEHETKAPGRYTEALLIKELEKRGIGRPSTYATIIERLYDKSYVVKENGALVPSFVAFAVVQLLESYFLNFVDYDFTSKMEGGLDGIAEGAVDQNDFLKSFYEGDEGLKSQVEQVLNAVQPVEVKHIKLPHIADEFPVMIGRYGPYVVDKTAGDKAVSIPVDLTPSTLNDSVISTLLKQKNGENGGDEPLGEDPESGQAIYLLSGRYGPYFQLGKKGEDNEKVKTCSVPQGKDPHAMTISEIMDYLSLPKELGVNPENGKPVTVSIGRYGPFVSNDGKNRNLSGPQERVFTITLEEALELLASAREPRKGKRSAQKAFKEYGEYEGEALGIFYGRYGYYGKLGKKNFALPKEMKKDESAFVNLSKERLIELYKESSNK